MLIKSLKIAVTATAVASAISIGAAVVQAGGSAHPLAGSGVQAASVSTQQAQPANDPWD